MKRAKKMSIIAAIQWSGVGLASAILAAIVVTWSPPSRAAENWPTWRGPRGDGVTTERELPLQWGPGSPNVRWRVELPEPSNSTPIVWGDKIFVTQPLVDEHKRTLMCLDRNSGEAKWQKSVVYDQEEPTHRTNPYCSPSPVTDGERVVVWYGSAGLYCYDLDGNELWHRDLGKVSHYWGTGSSPVLHGDLCFLNFGPGDPSFLLAVNKHNGQDVWRHDLPHFRTKEGPTGLGDDGNQSAAHLYGSWSTPVILPSAEGPLLLMSHAERLVAYRPQTGEEVWSAEGLADLVYMSPMWDDDITMVLGGYNGSGIAVRRGGKGNVTESHLAWRRPRTKGNLGTGVVHDGLAFVSDMSGIVECFNLATQEKVWEKRLAGAANNDVWSSLLLSGDRIYMLNKSGDTFVFKAGPKFELLATNSLDEETNSSIVPHEGELLIRTHEALWCIEKESGK
ncbi:MAG: PQQ-binding-like beta-propeller repeat protein [Pirellulaceae bacterium]|nr:PQQ-binding-like beta-propeller repeat protein [Planctomycetales bacterium]